MFRRLSALVLLSALAAGPVCAQTIYPLTRAEILAGSKFDLKVEFPGTPAASKVTINGRDAADVIGTAAKIVPNEDGLGHTAYWIRDASLAAGRYTVEATAEGKTSSVSWEVFATRPRVAKNVILFVGDGLSIAHRTAARIVSKGIVEGRYGGELAIDSMPHMALISTAGSDSIVTDSANAMSAYTTGHKSCVNALGVYCAQNKSTLDHPKVETIAELVKRRLGMAVGIITNTEIEDATPAGMVAHTRRRSDFSDIVAMFFQAKPEVIMGGGSPWFLPKAVNGSRRTDEVDYLKKFEEAGYVIAETVPGPDVQTDDEFVSYARQTGTTVFHASGSCRMGPDALSVVDDQLRVHGLEGLRVIDASVMPAVTSTNTNAPTIMIAEKGAAMVRAGGRDARAA